MSVTRARLRLLLQADKVGPLDEVCALEFTEQVAVVVLAVGGEYDGWGAHVAADPGA